MQTYIYKVKQLKDHTDTYSWWVVANDRDNNSEIKLVKVPHWLRNQHAVAIAISESLNKNTKLDLVDLV